MKRTIAQCLALMFVAGFTVQTATAMTVAEEMGWYDYATNPYDTGGDTGDLACGKVGKTLCGTTKKWTCTEWYPANGPVSESVRTPVCKTYIEITEYRYYP